MKNKYHVILSNIDHIGKIGHTTMICASSFIILANIAKRLIGQQQINVVLQRRSITTLQQIYNLEKH